MFRQIAVHQGDLQRVLWYEEDQLVTYRLTTVTYGLNCVPFLALRTIQQLVEDESHRFPKAIIPMTKGRYVDDIFGIDNRGERNSSTTNSTQADRFPLQKWSSNRPEVLSKTEDKSPFTIEIEPSLCKILGLVWKPDQDIFHFSAATSSDTSKLMKRVISSEIAKLYDPLGLIAPVLVRAKIIL